MAASAFAGTGVVLATASGSYSNTNDGQIGMNGGYALRCGADGTFSLSKSGVTKLASVTGRELQQLWQDLSEVGFKS